MFNLSPFIASIKKPFINASLDYFLIILLFYLIKLDLTIIKIFITFNVYAFCWVLVSYIIGRYSDSQEIIISTIKRNIPNTITTLFISGILFKIFLITNNYLYKNINLTLILSLTSISSYFLGNIQDYFFNKLSSENLKWISIFADSQEKSKFYNVKDINKYGLFKSIKSSLLNQSFEKYDRRKFGFIIEDINSFTNLEKSQLIDLKNKGYKIYNIVYWLERFLQRYPVDILNNSTILNSLLKLNFKDRKYRIKRIGETFLSLFLIFVTLPFIFISAVLIKLEDRGPIFYCQKRCGYSGSVFNLYKLRTMDINAERDGIRWSSKNDKRITKIGSFLRAIRFDEIPQLFSVLNGDMSLIGPRPERPEIDKLLISEISNYKLRYLVKPGISGWSQVNFPYGASIEDAKTKLSFDIFYIKNHSTVMDVLIMFKTIRLILNLKGSNPTK